MENPIYKSFASLGTENITVFEECVLLAELPGYDAYMAQVKYRFVPYIW